MSANNRRLRRTVVDLLWKNGAMSRNTLSALLEKERGLREVPSDTSLSSIMSKNVQLVQVGHEEVEKENGVKTRHAVFDINRDLIKCFDDIGFTRPPSCMTASEKRNSKRCNECGRHRIIADDSKMCLHCVRGREV